MYQLVAPNTQPVAWPQSWWQRHFGTPPAPVVGQVWRSEHSGKTIQIADVHVGDTGGLHVSVYYPSLRGLGMADSYCSTFHSWKQNIRAEKRELLKV